MGCGGLGERYGFCDLSEAIVGYWLRRRVSWVCYFDVGSIRREGALTGVICLELSSPTIVKVFSSRRLGC